ncbi:MAG: glycerol-3-phosphate 1-O-acyltransferase PlsY [candidate division WOR-3 bacterium]
MIEMLLFPQGSIDSPFATFLISLFFGYLLGSIPFGYLLPLLRGIDIRLYGSKNIGFTNVARNLGVIFALPVFLLDFAKGFLPTLLAPRLELLPLYVGLGSVLGHLFTPFLGFRGGKGVATSLGVVCALQTKIFLIGAISWIISFILFSYASLSSLIFIFILILSSFFFSLPLSERLVFILIALLVVLSHIPNLKRLWQHSEPKTHFGKRREKKLEFLKPSLLFLGAGRWAQSLSLLLAPKAEKIILWEGKKEKGEKSKELPEEISFPENIQFTTSPLSHLKNFPIIFFALPCSALREVLEKNYQLIPKEAILISTIKGIEQKTLKLPSQIISDYLPQNRLLILAGPGIPYEISQGKPSALILATEDISLGKEMQKFLANENLRVYLSKDKLGVEFGGALKNVFAIASGIVDSKGWGINAKSALLTRGLKEMAKLAQSYGARAETIFGLSGVGDLILTSFSPHSRNYQLGLEIGRGKTITEIRKDMGGVIEGIDTCASAYQLAKRKNLELPIMEEIYKILYLRNDPEKSLRSLLSRDLKEE